MKEQWNEFYYMTFEFLFISQCFRFLIYKMRVMVVTITFRIVKIK